MEKTYGPRKLSVVDVLEDSLNCGGGVWGRRLSAKTTVLRGPPPVVEPQAHEQIAPASTPVTKAHSNGDVAAATRTTPASKEDGRKGEMPLKRPRSKAVSSFLLTADPDERACCVHVP